MESVPFVKVKDHVFSLAQVKCACWWSSGILMVHFLGEGLHVRVDGIAYLKHQEEVEHFLGKLLEFWGEDGFLLDRHGRIVLGSRDQLITARGDKDDRPELIFRGSTTLKYLPRDPGFMEALMEALNSTPKAPCLT